ncbi:MAG TPA: IPT/TIG domain-containing protein, partial [Gemmatimonadaceae bacterium]|nr:IPT/TIG domain-containing protein [Gemmatimonadaceae bacterium]
SGAPPARAGGVADAATAAISCRAARAGGATSQRKFVPSPSERSRTAVVVVVAGGGAVAETARGRQRVGAFDRRRRRAAVALLLAGGVGTTAIACHDAGGPSPSAVYSLAVGAGDLQLTPVGSRTAEPLAVHVSDAGGASVKGVLVRFRLVAGIGARLDDSAAVTGIDGVARVELTVGSQPLDTVKVFAFVPGQEARGVTLRAVPTAAPTLTSLTPASFATGDTVLLGGTGLGGAASGDQLFFGGVPGRVIGAGDGGGLLAIVPPCVAPGPVQVQLRVGGAPAVSISGTYVASAVMALVPLEGATVPAANVGGCVSLPGDGARYVLVPNYALGDSRAATPFLLGGSGTVATPLVQARGHQSVRGDAQQRFDRMLRLEGQEMAATAAASARADGGQLGAALPALTLGSTRTFKVYGDLNGSTFKSATATLKFIGTNVLVYVDNDAPSSGFGDDELTKFGNLFDQTLYGIDVRAFGAESDVDHNGHVIMLLSPHVNELTDATGGCSNGIIVGFFTYYDLVSKSPNSNQGEVFYSVVPDPLGTRGCPISLTRARDLIPATFVHEFQHMISYNQHVLVRGGAAEAVWADEGMSHMAEELASRYYEDKYPGTQGRTDPNQLFPDSSQAFVLGDLENAFLYMNQSRYSSVTNFAAEGSLDERGGAWLFLRWLADHKGDDVLSRIVQSGDTGKRNVARKSGEDFARLFGDFSMALYTDSLPGVPRASVPARYRFTSRNLRQIFARLYLLGAPDVTAPFPITPPELEFNSTASVSGALPGGTMDFYFLTTPAGSSNVSLKFLEGGSPPGPFDPRLGAQLGVFRLPPGFTGQ